MDPTRLSLGAVTILAPVTVATNLGLALQCGCYYHVLRGADGEGRRYWSRFYLGMSVATLAGSVKHAFLHVLSPAELSTVLWISSMAAGLSVLAAQRATIAMHARLHRTIWLTRASDFQLAAYLGLNVLLGPYIVLVITNTAAGLLPVVVAEARAGLRGNASDAWIGGGLVLSMATALVYVARLSVGPWLTHVDVAHLMMGVSYWMILRGVRDRRTHAVLATRHDAVYL